MNNLYYFSMFERVITNTYGKILPITQYYDILKFSIISVTPLCGLCPLGFLVGGLRFSSQLRRGPGWLMRARFLGGGLALLAMVLLL